jgi:hypothetical protein
VLGPLWGGFAFEFLGYQFPFLTGAVFSFIIMLIGIFYMPKIVHNECKILLPEILNSEK